MEKTHPARMSIIKHFADVEDPRAERAKKHKLRRHRRRSRLRRHPRSGQPGRHPNLRKRQNRPVQGFLELPNGIPSRDAFGGVFAMLAPKRLHEPFISWTKEVRQLPRGEVAAIDGKTVRRSADHANGKSAVRMASAWASENVAALGQVKTGDRSNETAAIPKLLKSLELEGRVAAIDAMGCHNTVNKGHGRVEKRVCWAGACPPKTRAYRNQRIHSPLTGEWLR